MTVPDGFFLLAAGLVLGGAVLAVSLENVFYNALALMLSLFGVAMLFIFLNAEFLAVIEVIIYIGAISIAILFAIMLSQPMLSRREVPSAAKLFRAGAAAALVFLGLQRAIGTARWHQAPVDGDYGIDGIGKALLGPNVLPFEAVSLVLLVAIIGALVLAADPKERASK